MNQIVHEIGAIISYKMTLNVECARKITEESKTANFCNLGSKYLLPNITKFCYTKFLNFSGVLFSKYFMPYLMPPDFSKYTAMWPNLSDTIGNNYYVVTNLDYIPVFIVCENKDFFVNNLSFFTNSSCHTLNHILNGDSLNPDDAIPIFNTCNVETFIKKMILPILLEFKLCLFFVQPDFFRDEIGLFQVYTKLKYYLFVNISKKSWSSKNWDDQFSDFESLSILKFIQQNHLNRLFDKATEDYHQDVLVKKDFEPDNIRINDLNDQPESKFSNLGFNNGQISSKIIFFNSSFFYGKSIHSSLLLKIIDKKIKAVNQSIKNFRENYDRVRSIARMVKFQKSNFFNLEICSLPNDVLKISNVHVLTEAPSPYSPLAELINNTTFFVYNNTLLGYLFFFRTDDLKKLFYQDVNSTRWVGIINHDDFVQFIKHGFVLLDFSKKTLFASNFKSIHNLGLDQFINNQNFEVANSFDEFKNYFLKLSMESLISQNEVNNGSTKDEIIFKNILLSNLVHVKESNADCELKCPICFQTKIDGLICLQPCLHAICSNCTCLLYPNETIKKTCPICKQFVLLLQKVYL